MSSKKPHPPSNHANSNLDNETLLKINSKLSHITQLWLSGKTFFPRSLLEDLTRQIDSGKDEVRINDLDDVPQTYSLRVPGWCADFADTYRINYSSIHYLGHITPVFPELALRPDHTPVSIGYTRSKTHAGSTLAQVAETYALKRQLWRESSTCRSLEGILRRLPLSVEITKIVCFALGALGGACLEGGDGTRAFVQHAVVESMVCCLRERNVNAGGKRDIKCYAQDPAYSTTDAQFLSTIGIEVIADPKGFLEVDAATLVYSISPNVPVKQIVADVQWPAAMVWNTVCLEDGGEGWTRRAVDGEVKWASPFTTDPDCERVRRMVRGYVVAAVDDESEFLGDVSVYMK